MNRYDVFCPLSGSVDSKGNNFLQSSCNLKQQQPSLHKTCYPHCHMKSEKTVLSPPETKHHKPSIERAVHFGDIWFKLRAKDIPIPDIAAEYNVSVSTIGKYIRIFKQSRGWS